MRLSTSWVTIGLLTLSSAALGQSLTDRIKEGASELGQGLSEGADVVVDGAEKVGDRVADTTESTIQLFDGSKTPAETRAMLDNTAERALDELFAETPDAQDLLAQSAGYAVFDVRELTLVGVKAGGGRGVAVALPGNDRDYMNMATAGAGFAIGVGGFESQVIMFFETEDLFRGFVENGYDATAEAGSMFGDDTSELSVEFREGRAVFVLTKSGWKVSASVSGTRYWRATDLN